MKFHEHEIVLCINGAVQDNTSPVCLRSAQDYLVYLLPISFHTLVRDTYAN